MLIDLHVHSQEGSDGAWPVAAIVTEAAQRGIGVLAITDHDSLGGQAQAGALSRALGITCLTGIELHVTAVHPQVNGGKKLSLDFLGYAFDAAHPDLTAKLDQLRAHRLRRAQVIFQRVNYELQRQGKAPVPAEDIAAIQRRAEGSLGRPHIADYLVRQGVVRNRAEAFEKYLVHCDVPKMPLSPEEAAHLIRSAGGRVVLAHPNDPNGTSLTSAAATLPERLELIDTALAPFLDGVECWHSRHSPAVADAYLAFARERSLLATGGSDCHQDPVLLGTVPVPGWVWEQFC